MLPDTTFNEPTQINSSGSYQESSYQESSYEETGSYQRQVRVNIPRGHYPRPGECKVWDPVLPPGQQSAPVPCSSLGAEQYNDGRIVVYSDGSQEPY